MAAKLNRLTHKIATQEHLVAESSIISSSCFRRPVLKLLDYISKAHGEDERGIQNFGQRKNCGDLGIDGRVILKWILK
jgi:hypothetical protein